MSRIKPGIDSSPDLFDYINGDDFTHARIGDPDTSHDAAARVDISAQAFRVLHAYANGAALLDHDAYRIAGFPPGRTSHQRCSDLRERGYIKRTGERATTPAGRAGAGTTGYLCRITPAGLRYLRNER